MNRRALLVLTALLVPPAWAQEAAASPPPAKLQAFDLHGDAVRKIVRQTAASQSVTVQLSPEAPAPRDSAATIRFVPAEKPPAVRTPGRLVAASPAPSPGNAIFSSLVGAVVDNVVHSSLGIDPDVSTDEQYEIWRACRARGEKCLLPPAPLPD